MNIKPLSPRILTLSVLAASVTFAQAGTGLDGSYFNNVKLEGAPVLKRVDPVINFQWNNAAPGAGVPADKFSARWTGQILAPSTASYTFFTRSDDGVRLWVNGKLLIDNWTGHSAVYDQGVPVALTAGRKYDIQLEYFESGGGATMQLFWAYAEKARAVIPKESLFPAAVTVQPPPPAVSRVWLSDLNWLSASNGWGPPELDRSNGEKGAADGRRLQIAGRQYSHGLGTHAPAEIRYALDDRYDVFKAVIGIDDEVGMAGSAIFEVWGDGKLLYRSPMVRGNMEGIAIEVPVEDVQLLTLVVTNGGDNIGSDHADWADARFEGVETVKYLSSMGWEKATNGSGPVERDRTNGGAATKDGERIRLRGQVYRRGLGVFPASEIVYDLDKKYERLSAVVGIDDAAGAAGSAIFEVWTGTTRLFRSDTLRGGGRVQALNVSVAGLENLRLVVLDGGDGTAKDFADWADAKLLPLGSDAVPVIPGAVTDLTAVAGDGKVQLAWKAAPGATAYAILRGTATGAYSTTALATVSGLSYTHTGLTNGATYFYKVRGISAAGSGPLSNEVSAKPAPPAPAPTAAPTLSGAAGNAQVTLNWTSVTGATTYNLYRNGSLHKQGLTALTYNDTSLTNGTAYSYRVAGVNTGGVGPQANALSLTPVAGPVPTAAPVLSGTAGNAQVTLNWTAVTGATGYRLTRNGTVIQANLTALTFTNTGLTNGTAYTYRVQAFNANGQGPQSNALALTPIAAPVPSTAPVLTGTGASTEARLSWTAATGATSYSVFRNGTLVQANVTVLSFTNTGLTNGTAYRYRVMGVSAGGNGPQSNEVTVTPQVGAPTGAPTLTVTPGSATATLTWTAVTGATGYRVTRNDTVIQSNLNALTFRNTGLTNGTAYVYRVNALNAGGAGPNSNEVTVTPIAPPVAPTGVSATGGNTQISLAWGAVTGATSYRVYRGTVAGGQDATPLAANLTAPAFVNTGLVNGTSYFYRVTAVNGSGESPRSVEVSSAGVSAAAPVDPSYLAAFRLLRQATWGPRPGQVETVQAQGRAAFLDAQLAAPASDYPDVLYDGSPEVMQEHFMRVALTGNDQLRQRVAWALHKIWVISFNEISRPDAMVNYQRILLNRAFGNYRDLMRDITLNPGMGRYLNMVNNRSQAITNVAPNENYAREILQLFTMGLTTMGNNGVPTPGAAAPYSEADVAALARIFTGWTYGDGNPATIPTNLAGENFRVPLEPVDRFHDNLAKTFLNATFAPGRTTREDLEQALDVIFNHPNVPPFVCRQLIQQLVTSNPSAAYVDAISNVFINNGSGVRGDLRAVVRAILMHPEANLGANPQGKLQEPALYILSQMRALNAAAADHPFLTDYVEQMGQRVFYPGSVFSYYSPGFRVRGTALAGPEFQILTSVTALEKVNFTGRLLGGSFGSDVTIDYGAFTSRAGDAGALVDYCNRLFMGGQMSTAMRDEIVRAVQVTPASNTTERARTALYLTMVGAQYSVDR